MRPEVPICKITIVAFSVFDSEQVDRHKPDKGITEMPFYNSTPEQCVKYIKKNIWETAQIKAIHEYNIMEGGCRKISVTTILQNIDRK